MPSLVSLLTFFTLALFAATTLAEKGGKAARIVGGKTSLTQHDLTEDPTITELGVAVARHFDDKSAHQQTVFTSPQIISGTKQVVAGMRYDLRVQLFKTQCPRSGPLPSDEHPCPRIGSKPFCTITASVWSRPWLGESQVTLEEDCQQE